MQSFVHSDAYDNERTKEMRVALLHALAVFEPNSYIVNANLKGFPPSAEVVALGWWYDDSTSIDIQADTVAMRINNAVQLSVDMLCISILFTDGYGTVKYSAQARPRSVENNR